MDLTGYLRRIMNMDALETFDQATDSLEAIRNFLTTLSLYTVIGFGTLTADSQTVPADNTRAGLYAWENDDYFKGAILMPTAGDCRYQPRPIGRFTVAGGIFTLDEAFTQLPGLVDYVLIRSDYPYQRLLDIFNIINAILVTTETGGTLTTDGTEQTVYTNATPAGVFEPLSLLINCTNLALGETIVIRTFAQINPAGALIPEDEQTFAGPCDARYRLKEIVLKPNRFGYEVTLEQTGGAVGVNYDWSVIVRI